MSILKSIWDFLGLYQTKKIRILHVLILLLVISQIIVSNWMTGTKSVVIPFFEETYLFTWIHIVSGFVLFFLTFFLVVLCF
ncbi:cytochrome b/b6 domain-containing protein, partial [Providencia stuartii]